MARDESSLKTQHEPDRRRHRTLGASDLLLALAIVLIVGLWTYTRLIDTSEQESHAAPLAMPAKVRDEAERQLYLEPAGLYTVADIEANGGLMASERFAGFRAKHDLSPQPGDQLCPITQTKANPECQWTIGGRSYAFCCPPCIDEFLELAKEQPERILPPESYVK